MTEALMVHRSVLQQWVMTKASFCSAAVGNDQGFTGSSFCTAAVGYDQGVVLYCSSGL
ncbi:hypothetical protein DPMN_086639 [Dreissena polymorpha]|uniref:Uncharacterized protein n=1 Tax=Dreissena polymorpha TaxID=45954 RepID=A0A9D4QUS1_DREPO|nr:hypothetical protein DPMN_086639 [Dreissena polymorpha]